MTPMSSPLDGNGVDDATCERCQGNGEIVTDWERYRHPRDGDVGDEAVASCPDCDGTGALAPSQTAVEPVALAQALKNLTEGAEQEDREILYAAASTLTAQAAARVAAERERDEAWGDLSKAAGAIGSVRFMDPPDGGDVTLAEQVVRMREALTAAESEVATLKGRIAELEAGLEPFAKHLDEMKFDRDNNGNELPDDQSVGWVYVTNGDFRRARRLTHQEKNG